jgi:Arc/MetJ-type ribon-helix-helix transcriptional regulator
MTTINISLPDKLKEQAETLVDNGFYASFSDLIRDSLRQIIAKSKYDLYAEEAKEDLKNGKAKVLKTRKAVDDYFKTL